MQHVLELPMLALGVAWLVLALADLVSGLSGPWSRVVTAIWAAFVLEFVLELVIAPRKAWYLRRNWLGAVALLLPAVRILRVARVLRAVRLARGLRVLRLVTSTNRGLGALRRTMRRRGLGYVVSATLVVALSGAAGMMAFEGQGSEAPAFATYGEALWWTALLLTSIGSEPWPRTVEGRVLSLVLAVYGFGVFGYVTATLASHFVGRDADERSNERAGRPGRG